MRLPLSPADRENRRGCFVISLIAVVVILIIVFLAIQAKDKPKTTQVLISNTQ